MIPKMFGCRAGFWQCRSITAKHYQLHNGIGISDTLLRFLNWKVNIEAALDFREKK